MRYILYVESKQEGDRLLKNTTINRACKVQVLSKVELPEWMQSLARPMLADMQDDALYYGEDALQFLKSKQKTFGALEELE